MEIPRPRSRDILKVTAFAFGTIVFAHLPIPEAHTQTSTTEVVDQGGNDNWRKFKKGTELRKFLKNHDEERRLYGPIVSIPGLMSGVHPSVTRELALKDFNMYWAIYKVGEKKYGVPAGLTFVIHESETEASRNKNADGSGFLGAMQLHPMHFNNPYILNAPSGKDFLAGLDQRYTKTQGFRTNDWENILQGVAFISSTATRVGLEQDEPSFLRVVESFYSAPGTGRVRVDAYLRIKEALSAARAVKKAA